MSPSVVASASAMFGPSNGAITMALSTITPESRTSPTAATTLLSATITRNTRFSFAVSSTPAYSSSRLMRPTTFFGLSVGSGSLGRGSVASAGSSTMR